jgi:hypothetical protein
MPAGLLTVLLMLSVIFSTGCGAVIVGAGAGAGVYTYTSGELKRTYNVPFDKAVSDSLAALRDLKMTYLDKKAAGLVTTIFAEKSDETPVTITITMQGSNLTEIAVRTGVVGFWDKKVSELVHAQIAKRLF